MRAITVYKPAGLARLAITKVPEPKPGPGEVLVQWYASSLNYHDYLVVTGNLPVNEGRIPMSDGAGKIVAIGSDVSQW